MQLHVPLSEAASEILGVTGASDNSGQAKAVAHMW